MQLLQIDKERAGRQRGTRLRRVPHCRPARFPMLFAFINLAGVLRR